MAVLSTGLGRRAASKRRDRNGDTFCVQRLKSFRTSFSYGGFTIKRVPVSGSTMDGATILKTCKAKGMRPVCGHVNYMDGNCILVGGKWHFSHPRHTNTKRRKIPRSFLQGIFVYTGYRRMALHDRGSSHRWASSKDTGGDTLCTSPRRTWAAFTFNHYKFTRVKVSGIMNSANINTACRALKMRPVCEHAHYADGKCRMVGGAWHLASPKQQRRHRISVAKLGSRYRSAAVWALKNPIDILTNCGQCR